MNNSLIVLFSKCSNTPQAMISILILHFNSSYSIGFYYDMTVAMPMKWFNHIEYITLYQTVNSLDVHMHNIYFPLYRNKFGLLHPIKMIYLTVFDTFDCLTRVIGPFSMAMCFVEMFSICLICEKSRYILFGI